MNRIRVNYHWEPEGWSAESPDRPSWSAWGESFPDVRQLTVEAMLIEYGRQFALTETILPPKVRLQMSGAAVPGRIVAASSDREPSLA